MFTTTPTFSQTQIPTNDLQSLDNGRIPVKRPRLVFRPPFRVLSRQQSQLSQSVDSVVAQAVILPNSHHNDSWNFQSNANNLCHNSSVTELNGQQLRSVAELPSRFHGIFKAFRYFNVVQSTVFDDVYYSEKSIVVCAPTGSGKTVIMELAIISLLQQTAIIDEKMKIIYMAPIKALCSERYEDWKEKFRHFGLNCAELTGDTETDDYSTIQMANLIFTTPEKWDSTTRRWRDSKNLIYSIKLFLIDEIHVVNDESRGATIEAVISRMLTINACQFKDCNSGMRLIAVSATIPNVEDFAVWFESTGKPAVSHKVSDDLRPVKLRKEVLGYFCSEKWTDFKFDLNLSYKLSSVIHTYSNGKPTLVFCSTRKGSMQAAGVLAPELKYRLTPEQKQLLGKIAITSIKDSKLKEAVACGVGFHHAGLEVQDRKTIEQLFNEGSLLVLTATSTLAMGVNMPAHLVIIKSTTSFLAGTYIEYSNTQILQMIGRAGRPQFDSTATAVIMTKDTLKTKYERFLNGHEVVESRLHKNLAEYINAEVVLSTITDLSVAMQWLRSTLFYVRVMKNPDHYGIKTGFTEVEMENELKEMCLKELNSLHDSNIIQITGNNFNLKATDYGRLMARYCVSLDTTKKFLKLKNSENIKNLIELISTCKEFSDVQLRTSDKKSLNSLNNDKHLPTIRFQLEGKIRSREMKVNCLIQTTFGCLPLQDANLNQECMRIIRIGQRLSKFLYEIVFLDQSCNMKSLVASLTVAKCFNAKLWENSILVARQLDKIGITMATALANAGLTTFEKIEQTNPRQLELIVNRHPPFGNHIKDAVTALPKCIVKIEQTDSINETSAEIIIFVSSNRIIGESKKAFANQITVVIIGDRDNKIILKQKLGSRIFQDSNVWSKQMTVNRAQQGDELTISLINEHYVGLDLTQTFIPKYQNAIIPRKMLWSKRNPINDETVPNSVPNQSFHDETKLLLDAPLPTPVRRSCNHHCLDKKSCSHDCCKTGVLVKTKRLQKNVKQLSTSVVADDNSGSKLRQTTIKDAAAKCRNMASCTFDEVRLKSIGNLKIQNKLNTPLESDKLDKTDKIAANLKQFSYKPNAKCYRRASDNNESFNNCEQTEKPNFEIYLESDFDDQSETNDSIIIVSSSDSATNESFQCEKIRKSVWNGDDVSYTEGDNPNLLYCGGPKEKQRSAGNSFLSAKNVYQRTVQMTDSFLDESSGVSDEEFIVSEVQNCVETLNASTSLEPSLVSNTKYSYEETEVTTQLNVAESDDEIAASTFENLFGDLF